MKKAIAVFVAGVVIGGVLVGLYARRVAEREIMSLWFVEELHRAQAATRQLRLLNEGQLDTLHRITKMQMESGIQLSYQLMVSARPESAPDWPHLLPGLSYTEEYVRANDSESHLLARLQELSDYVVSGKREN